MSKFKTKLFALVMSATMASSFITGNWFIPDVSSKALLANAETTSGATDSRDPFAAQMMAEPAGFDTAPNPYAANMDEAINIAPEKEVLIHKTAGGYDWTIEQKNSVVYSDFNKGNVNENGYSNADLSIDSGRSFADSEGYAGNGELAFTKAIGFDPNGTGRDDHVAYIGWDYAIKSYVAYVMDANTGKTSDHVILGNGEAGNAKWVGEENGIEQSAYNNFHAITAGDYDGDGKETFVVTHNSPTDDFTPGVFLQELMLTNDRDKLNLKIVTKYEPFYGGMIHGLYIDHGGTLGNPDRHFANALGTSLATGDFNTDGIDDLAIAAYVIDPTDWEEWNSETVALHKPQLTFIHGERNSGIILNEKSNWLRPGLNSARRDGNYVYDRTVAFPSISAGDVDGDGYDEVVIAGYALDLKYESGNYSNDESKKVVSKELNTGVFVGVYGYKKRNEIVKKSVMHYQDCDDDDVEYPIMNEMSQQQVYYFGGPRAYELGEGEERKTYKYYRKQVVALLPDDSYVYEFDYSSDQVNIAMPQFMVETVATNSGGGKEQIFLNGTLVDYNADGSVTHAFTPEWIDNFMPSELYADHVNDGFGTSLRYGAYAYIQSVAVGSFDGNAAGREQVMLTMANRMGEETTRWLPSQQTSEFLPVPLLASEWWTTKANNQYTYYPLMMGGNTYGDSKDSSGNTVYGAVQDYFATAPTLSDDERKQEGIYESSFFNVFGRVNNGLNFIAVSVDTGNDGMVAKYRGKSWRYADPEVIAVLQATPYYGDLGHDGNSQTSYSITRSYTVGDRSSQTQSFSVGISTEAVAGPVKTEINSGYTEGWTSEFEQAFTQSYTITFSATDENVVAMTRTPVFMYFFQLEDENGEYLEGEDMEYFTIAVPGKPLYTTVSVEDYNAFVDYYNATLNAGAQQRFSKITSAELTENEGDLDKYRISANGATVFSEMISEANFTGGISVSVEMTEEQSSAYTTTSGFYFDSTISVGFSAPIVPLEAWAGVSAGIEGETSYGSFNSTANATGSEGSIASPGDSGDYSPEFLSGYSFSWQFGSWPLNLDAQKDSVPVFGYIINDKSDVTPSPKNVKTEAVMNGANESIRLSWDEINGATYNVYRIENDEFTLISKGTALTSEYVFEIPENDSASFYTFVISAVRGEKESVYSKKITYYKNSYGKSAYDIALENGFEGSAIDWLASLKGDTGENGLNGTDGIGIDELILDENGNLIAYLTDGSSLNCGRVVGSDGTDGVDGKDGLDGKDGVDGIGIKSVSVDEEGNLLITLTDDTVHNAGKVVGLNGADGTDGVDGKDGVNGKDGLDGKDGTNGKDGTDGKDGLTPFIGENGNWWIGETDTGVAATVIVESNDGGCGSSITGASIGMLSLLSVAVVFLNKKKEQ